MILALFLSLFATAPSFSSTAKGTAELLCASENGDNKPPRLQVRAAGGHRLFLCAVNAKKRQGRLELRGGFRVFMLSKNGKKRAKPLYESEPDTSMHSAEAMGQKLHLKELVWDGKENLPAFETVLSCDDKTCRASSPATCVFQNPKPGSRRALEQIEEFQHGKKQGKSPEKKLIDSLATLAYSGDADAQAIFHDRGTLSLDGASSDAYFDHQTTLARLKKAGCL